MIFDTLENLPKYAGLVNGLDKVIGCLQTENLAEKKAGAYMAENKDFRYSIGEYETAAGGKRFEKHRLYLDVQIMLEGSEKMDFTLDSLCGTYDEYNTEKDVTFADGKTLLSFTAAPGTFVIFFAGEPHMPGLAVSSPQRVKKAIFKIKE